MLISAELMHGIVSLLDDEHYRRIEEVWEELAERYGVRGIYAVRFPHFTYQVSEEYDVGQVSSALRALAEATAPFRVRTAGLGVFCSARPVLHLPVVRNRALARLHAEVWRAVGRPPVGEVARFYGPEMWVPHVTLAQGDLDSARLAEIVRELSTRDFHWELEVNNVSLIYDVGSEQGLRCRFNFRGVTSE